MINTSFDKMKKQDRDLLNNLIGNQYEKTKFIDEEVSKLICAISEKYNLEVGLVISRKGVVKDIFIGDKHSCEIKIEHSENLLTGERIIHTHPNGSSTLSDMDLSLLKNNMSDCICAIGVKNGEPYDANVAFYDGEKITNLFVYDARYINKNGILDRIYDIDKDLKNRHNKLSINQKEEIKAILVFVDFGKSFDAKNSFEELEGLARTANINVVDTLYQKKNRPDSRYLIGEGKLVELKNKIQLYNANLVVFENELNGSKLSNLEEYLGVKVLDRSMLILDIFAGRAKTKEGKLQVELAQLKYSLPRLSSLNMSDGRFGGGVGMRGPGETKLELNRRIVEKNILKYTKELEKLKKQRELNRKNRTSNSKPVVSIVGYTNSGKSSLLNLLAKSDAFVKDELFATLDTTTRNVWINSKMEVLMTDTVGFINNLPHEFIEAFASTLEECVYSDLLLHVVDISNPNYLNQIKVTNSVLNKLGCDVPIIMVFNKIDKVDLSTIIKTEGVYISVKNQINIEKLKNEICKALK